MTNIKRINFGFAPQLIAGIINSINNVDKNGLDLQPYYQRGYIWSKEFKEKLIYSIAVSYPIGNIIIRNLETPNDKGAKSEVVDGQQRLTTIYNFVNDAFSLDSSISKEIIIANLDYFEEDEDKKVQKILENFKKDKSIRLKFSDLPKRIQTNINSSQLAITTISNTEKGQVEEYFRFVQNQERLRAGEIIQSFPDTKLEKYVLDIHNKDELLRILGFSDNRREFEKIFYSMIGLFEGKINFGTTDKEIIKFVTEQNEEISKSKGKIMSMTSNLNKILSFAKIEINSNKRLLKYILLLCAFNLLDLNKNSANNILKILEEINIKLSVFNSAKKGVIEKTFGEDKQIIEKYRQLALLTKGSHTLKKTEEETISLSEEIKRLLNN